MDCKLEIAVLFPGAGQKQSMVRELVFFIAPPQAFLDVVMTGMETTQRAMSIE